MANYRIFLSHSHRDNDFCRRVVDHIKHALPDTDIFYDEHTIIGGDEWMRRVQREVLERPIFIVILSPHSVESEWVREETNLVLSEAVKRRERRIIPIRYQECDVTLLAALLLNRQIVDCASQDESTGLRQLVDAIHCSSSPERPPIVEQTLQCAYELSAQIHIAYRDERWDDVMRLGRVALQLQGNECDGDTLGEVGIALIRHGNIDEGKRSLDAALQIQALRPDFWLARARLLSQNDEHVDEAIASLDAALVVTRDVAGKVAILQEELAILTRASRAVESIAVIDETLRLTPHNATLWTLKGDALARLGRTHEAIAAYERALTSDPQDARTWREIAHLLLSVQRADEALAAYDRALALNPNDEANWSARARALIVQGEFEAAIAATHRALALVPHDTSIWLTKAEALCAMGKYDEALAIYDRVLAVAPRDMQALLAKGNALAHLRRWQEVVWLCDHALAHLPPAQSDLLLLKAQALIALGDVVSALGVFDHAARTGPPTAAMLTAKGNVLMRLGRYGEALTVYNRAIQMNPAAPAIWYQKAIALFHLSRLPEAHSACDNALQLDGNNSLLWSAKGAMLYWSRRYAEALHVYDRALRLNTTNLHALTGRAMALWAQRRYAESLAACDYALTLSPSDGDALRTRQFALFALGRTHEAEQMVPGTGTSTLQPLGQTLAGG